MFSVIERNGWSYVVGEPIPEFTGPWRYHWEAQEYADELNAKERSNRPVIDRILGTDDTQV